MATKYPLETLGPTLTVAGISVPPYADIYQSLQASFQAIYGSDAYIDPDSQDGQLLAVIAKAIHDANQAAVSIYNSFSPSKAEGEALSSNVKINGIARKVPTKSQVVLNLTGVAGTVITNGVAEDSNGNRWDLPATVTIGSSGSATVTALAQNSGAVTSGIADITQIVTPTLGWQSVTNPSSPIKGAPVEKDGELRIRQALAVSNQAVAVINSIHAAISALPGVLRSKVYENDTDTTNAFGLPPYSISAVVYGGDATEIATAIRRRKTPGAATAGSTTVTINDELGDPININFDFVTTVDVLVGVAIKQRPGFTTSTSQAIKEAIANYINTLDIGQRVDLGRIYLPAQLFGQGAYGTYEVNGITLAASPDTPTAADLEIAHNEMAICTPANVTITVTP